MASRVNLVSIRASGNAKDIARRLGVSQKLVRDAIADHLRDYGKALTEAARDEAPVKEGKLRESIRYQVERAGTVTPRLVVTAGNKQRPEVVVKTVLFGSLPHWIPKGKPLPPGTPRKLYTWVDKTGVRRWRGWHPGTVADNFLQRAIKRTEGKRRSLASRLGKLIVDRIGVGERTDQPDM